MRFVSVLLLVLVFPVIARTQELKIDNLRQFEGSLAFRFNLTNNTQKDFFMVVPDPVEPIASSYFLVYDDSSGVLDVDRALYSISFKNPGVVYEGSGTYSALMRIKPGASYVGAIALPFPKSGNHLPIPRTIDLTQIKAIRFRLGLLPYDPAILELIRPQTERVSPEDIIERGDYAGKGLVEIQVPVTSQLLVYTPENVEK